MNRWWVVTLVGLLPGVAPAVSEPQGHLQPGSDPSVLPGPILGTAPFAAHETRAHHGNALTA